MAHSAKIGKMGLKNQLTKTPYLVLFIVLISIGVGTASALITITLSGDVIITGFLDMTGDKIANVDTPTLASDAATKAYVDSAPGTDTLALLGCTTDQVARWTGTEWTCSTISVINNLVTTVDSAGDIGEYTSIALATGDKPVISYYGITLEDLSDLQDLKLAICNDTICSSPTITTVDSGGDVGQWTSIALASGDKPVISYIESDLEDLKLAVCNDTICSSPTITTVDDALVAGTSIVLASGDIPMISYYHADENLNLATCNDSTCSSPTLTTIESDGLGINEETTSIALASGDKPVISYYYGPSGDLKIAVCNDTVCSSPTITTVDSINDVGTHLSMVLASGDKPVISYYDATFGDLKIAVCNDTVCSSPTIRVIDGQVGDAGKYTSIALDSSGNPVISYIGPTNDDLRFVVCNNPTCSSSIITTVDSIVDFAFTSIALASGDQPVISYEDRENGDLRLFAVVSSIVKFD